MNDPRPDDGINVRSDGYWMARGAAICPHCRGETRVVALVLPPGHETRSIDEDDDEDDEDKDKDDRTARDSALREESWEIAACHAVLFYIDFLPDAVRRRIQALAPRYRLAVSPASQGSYWANHCERCGGIQEDHDLFCEPEGAFLPVSPAAASVIELLPVHEILEAAAAGYAMDPEFLGTPAGA